MCILHVHVVGGPRITDPRVSITPPSSFLIIDHGLPYISPPHYLTRNRGFSLPSIRAAGHY